MKNISQLSEIIFNFGKKLRRNGVLFFRENINPVINPVINSNKSKCQEKFLLENSPQDGMNWDKYGNLIYSDVNLDI